GHGSKCCCGTIGARSKWPAGCGATASSPSAMRRSIATSGPTSAPAARSTSTCAEHANRGASYGRYDSRGRLAGKRPITERPPIVEMHQELGHWEADTMLGASQAGPCVLSLVERKT